jgi:hypothetical protein
MTSMISFVFYIQLIIVILILTQNGYRIKHLILGSNEVKETKINEYYERTEVITNDQDLHRFLKDTELVIVNDLTYFKNFANLGSLKKESRLPLIINQKFEVFMPKLNKYYRIFNDKEMLAFTGIMGILRPFHEYDAPFIPRVNYFELVLKGLFISIFVNFSIYNKLEHQQVLEIINKPFLNLVYLHFNFFKVVAKNLSEILDKAENPIFPREHYNFLRTKDKKYISVGNLEPKFQKNFIKVFKQIDQPNSIDSKTQSNNEEKKFEYNYDTASELFEKHNRDEVFGKLFNTETCTAPVLTIEEAIEFQKNLNKFVQLDKRMKNNKKLGKLKEIEDFLFKNMKGLVMVDFNAKIFAPKEAVQKCAKF